MAKVFFSRRDIIAINESMSKKPLSASAPHGTAPARSRPTPPSSPIVDRLMREIGVSDQEIRAAFRIARLSVKPK